MQGMRIGGSYGCDMKMPEVIARQRAPL